MAKKISKATKPEIIEDIILVNEKYKKKFKDAQNNVTRDYYREHGKYSCTLITRLFGSYSKAVLACEFKKEEIFKRENITIIKERDKHCKKYICTGIVPDQPLSKSFMKSIRQYCEVHGAQLCLLTMRGSYCNAPYPADVFEEYKDYFVTEMNFNSNLVAMDFLIRPQQILSLTGLDRIAANKSVIIAHTKQTHHIVENRIGSYPHVIWSTGVCTETRYNRDRLGRIGAQDHEIGGLIVEVEDDGIFHIRNFQADVNGGFADYGKYYNGETITNIKCDISLGDIHAGDECPVAIGLAKQIIKDLRCENVYLHDLFNGASINHHEENNAIAQLKRKHYQRLLSDELDYTGNFLKDFYRDIEFSNLVVVPSNHNEFLDRYLKGKNFLYDVVGNLPISTELFAQYAIGNSPLEYYLQSRNFLNEMDISFPKRNDIINSYGYDIIHGDRGISGARGNLKSLDKCYGKNSSAHTHSSARERRSVKSGTNSLLDLSYIEGFGSKWIHSDVILYENGTDQIITKINGKYKLD